VGVAFIKLAHLQAGPNHLNGFGENEKCILDLLREFKWIYIAEF
jgi:hypothetical protein